MKKREITHTHTHAHTHTGMALTVRLFNTERHFNGIHYHPKHMKPNYG